MRALHVSANLHTTASGWYCSSEDEGGIVGKAAKTNKKNRKGFSLCIPVVAFPSVHQRGLCRKLPGMVCLQNSLAFLGLILAFVVPKQMDT